MPESTPSPIPLEKSPPFDHRADKLLAALWAKHLGYIGIVDRRAQTIITINAFLIPLILSQIDNPRCAQAGPLFVLGGFVSMLCAIIALLPNRFRPGSAPTSGLLHFTTLWPLDEATYLDQVKPLLTDIDQLGPAVARDIYHLSCDVLRPKFRWLTASYLVFVLCLIAAGVLYLTAPYR